MSNKCYYCGLEGTHVYDCPNAKMGDDVNHPKHYTKGRFETIEIIEDVIQFYEDPILASQVWQVLKYLARAPHKNDLAEDLRKARWYLDRAIRTAEALVSDRKPS